MLSANIYIVLSCLTLSLKLKMLLNALKKLRKIFPTPMPILWGNHDIRIQRLAEKSLIPNSFLKDINDILEIDKKWKWTWHNKINFNRLKPNKTKVFFIFLHIILNQMFYLVLKN